MKDSKRHSRSLVVTLLDLKNAFGEVHHNLIRESLKYHHLPDIFVDLFNSIYSDCSISVSANNQWTDPIGIKKGVLQGDPCSPLLFNLCFNTLMRTLKKSNLVNLGYIWGPKHSTNECAWLQFADDAVILSKSTSDAQSLLDIFVAWCNWSGMVIRLDKCASFAMTKRDDVFQQIEPALFVDQERIPSIPIGGHFIYLGKIFDFDLKNEQAKKVVKEKLLKLLKITSLLRIQVQMRLKILKTYIHSQLSFELRMYNFGSTWIEENLDMETNNQVRDWLNMPPSGCISEMLALPKHKCGLGIPSFLDVAEILWLRKRFKFKNSNQRVLRQMWSESSKDHVRMDAIASESDKISTATAILCNQQMAGKEAHFLGLKMQGESPKVIIESISRKNLTSWNNLFDRLPQFLFQFARKALQQQLPTASNLYRWKKLQSPMCTLCGINRPQTNLHVLSNCSYQKALDRYTQRHNNILSIIANWIASSKPGNMQLFVDLSSASFGPIDDVFQTCVRPDLILYDGGDNIFVLELSVCHESNLQKTRLYKQNKYVNISQNLTSKFSICAVELYTLEVSVLGFQSDLSEFCAAARLPVLPDYIKTEISKVAINSSYNIYRLRNSAD